MVPQSVGSKQNWRTPSWIFKGMNDVIPFTLDAAADKDNALVKDHYFDTGSDALRQQWHGNVWCNPPYRIAGRFVAHGLQQVKQFGSTVVFLLRIPSIGANWYVNAAPQALTVLITPRFDFVDPDTGVIGKGCAWSSMFTIMSPDTLTPPSDGLRMYVMKAKKACDIVEFFNAQ